ncbi:hypothetical protein, partial [uncultured Cardiobacterium sp.]|uniref:hypothetical protein n=1 Tax=uncultured Cardiobacterium sp. TaxID=417619 RepID=UPI002638E135
KLPIVTVYRCAPHWPPLCSAAANVGAMTSRLPALPFDLPQFQQPFSGFGSRILERMLEWIR